MELLASISLESFKIHVWTVSLVVGGLWFFIAAHKQYNKYWVAINASLLGLFAASVVFLLSNLGVAFYILSRATDPRWSEGKEPIWSPNELESNLPFINEVVDMLNGLQDSVSGAVNNVGAIQNALLAAGDFLWMVVVSIPVIVILSLASFIAGKWAKKRDDKFQAAERAKEVQRINRELSAIKRHIGMTEPDVS